MATPALQRLPSIGWPEWECPRHGAEVGPDMRCRHDGHAVPVVRGIPRFAQSAYTRHFGNQWNRYRLTQLDSWTGLPITQSRLFRCLGPAEVEDLHVLECGCGAGRFTEVLLDMGALVTSIDLSDAVEANAKSFPIGHRHRIAQADILRLPFAARQFDVVLCLGVIQHTPSPEQTIAALYQQVRPGGYLVIDHYPVEWQWYTRTAPLFRAVLKRLPPEASMKITEALVRALLPVHKAVAHTPALRSVWSRISPLLTYYADLPELSDEMQYEWSLLDTHDSLTDWYKHRRSVGGVRGALEALGAAEIEVWRGGNGVEARCRRPIARQ